MLAETTKSHTRSFLSLHHKKTNFELALPAAKGKWIWGSPYGWIVTLDDKHQVHLLNLISQIQLQLPPLPTIETIHPEGFNWVRWIYKSLTFKISPTKFLIAVILNQPNNLYFARVPAGVINWRTVQNPDNFIIRDVAYLKGQVYVIRADGSLLKIEFNEPLAATTHLFASGPVGEAAERGYLVKSSDALFGIFVRGDYGVNTETFTVYKLNPVWDIDGLTFFVGNGNSWSVRYVDNVNYKKNSIYFRYDNWEQEKSPYTYGIYDMGEWANPNYLIVDAEFDGYPRTQYSRPTWVAHGLTPNLFR